ncbi:MAG: J domain-containing protein [Cyanobacteriota bacterium]|nr:J domain-containing protein [Cyanobacteriota bacterium]
MATRPRKLLLPEVQDLIDTLLSKEGLAAEDLLSFAQLINGGPFKVPPPPKVKPLGATAAKKAVLAHFECTTATQLKKCQPFLMQMGGEDFGLKTTEDWLKLYRKFIAVPEHERKGTGPTCVNGIDVLQNFRPWHVFGLNPHTATAEDVKSAFRELAKTHHPDMGGDPRVFARLQKMRDSVLALMG